jgi:hypothetical protein
MELSVKRRGKKLKLRELRDVDEIYFMVWSEVFGLDVRPEALTKYNNIVGDTLVSFKLYLSAKDYIFAKVSLWFYNRKNGTRMKLKTCS